MIGGIRYHHLVIFFLSSLCMCFMTALVIFRAYFIIMRTEFVLLILFFAWINCLLRSHLSLQLWLYKFGTTNKQIQFGFHVMFSGKICDTNSIFTNSLISLV